MGSRQIPGHLSTMFASRREDHGNVLPLGSAPGSSSTGPRAQPEGLRPASKQAGAFIAWERGELAARRGHPVPGGLQLGVMWTE